MSREQPWFGAAFPLPKVVAYSARCPEIAIR